MDHRAGRVPGRRREPAARTALVAIGLAVALAGGGCVFESSTTPAPIVGGGADPRGTDASLQFSWLINGQNPQGPGDPCHDAGVQFIRMSVVDAQGQSHTYGTFQWDCHIGSYHSAQPELRAGSFGIYWEAVAADGTRLSLAPARQDTTVSPPAVVPAPETVTFTPGESYDFDAENTLPGGPPHPTDFATADGTLDLALGYQPPSASGAPPGMGVDCATAGVNTITWQLVASNGVVVEDHTQAEVCTHYPSIHWGPVYLDTYAVNVTATDATNAIRWRGSCPSLLARQTLGTPYACTISRTPGG